MTDTPEERRALFLELRERAFELFSEIQCELGEEAARRIFTAVLDFKIKRERGKRGPGKQLVTNPSKDAERKRIKNNLAYALVSKLPPPSDK